MEIQMTFLGLVVKDLAQATEFYTQKLGLKIDEAESVPNLYTQFVMAGETIFSLLGGFEQEGINQTFDPALLVADADAVYTEWQTAGVEMIGEPHTMPFGRTFLCRTPEGHVLRIYSRPSAN
jgi:predicted enzyme related to lactoylglutathione lyase